MIKHQAIDQAMIAEGDLVFWFDADRWKDDDRSWNRSGSQQDLLREYEGFDERALALLRMADPSTLKVWRLMDMDTV
ncbi:hypothetical protein BM221_003790 [Beauveria bassiana]|uniref:Uncharacterized protein n=1 Tax=Beauveria bassiana TaxID=176275 RepID=A0A2N6NVM1_BEABA|nr:hypothetical protein BM221_003790 [Beauveria bassiana]